MSPQERCLLVEGWKYSVSTLYVSRTITKTARFKRWLMSFCTVVVFVDKLLVSDTHLIYEHTTFASQNDVQNHHKNIWPRFGLKIRGGGGNWEGPAPPLDLPLNSLRLYYLIIFPISNIHSLWWLQKFLLSSHVLWHYPRQYMNTVMCTYFYIISMANSITSHIQSLHCLRNVLRAIFLYRKMRKIHPPSPPPEKKNTNYQKPTSTRN